MARCASTAVLILGWFSLATGLAAADQTIDLAQSEAAAQSTFDRQPATFDQPGEGYEQPATSSDDGPATSNVPAPYSPEGARAMAAAPSKPKGPAKNPAATAYKGVFYDNDFKYLNSPKNKDYYLGDNLKQIQLGDCWVVDIGGEYRLRQHNENNLRGSNLTGLDDNFLLQRTRTYVDAKYSDVFRFYGEMIDATSSWENFPPRNIEENRFDALNLFADALLLSDVADGKLWARAGRQELLYGDQRLISPLDWSNTRRTFDGGKLFFRGDDWDVDAFLTRPVPFSQHVNNDHNFDHPDASQYFTGVYSSYKGCKDHVYDFYYLRLVEGNASGAITPLNPTEFDVNTFGARWKGKNCNWLVDVEGGYQFGDFGAEPHSAGFATAGLGHEWSNVCWKPIVWVYYDWASGDANVEDGTHGTFNQLFPLGHKYFGYADLVARQNIHDLNFQFTAKPGTKLTLLAWYHIFHLDQSSDALYNAAGVPIRQDPTGAAGTDVGQEIDLTAQYSFSPRADVLFGYSHFYAGDFVKNTNPAGVTGDVDFYYTQFSYRF